MSKFNKVKSLYLKKLEQFVPIVARVHGSHHPEFFEVKRVFDDLVAKIKENDASLPNLDEEFNNIRNITNNYTVLGDVCETYEAVYKMLEELDLAYFESN